MRNVNNAAVDMRKPAAIGKSYGDGGGDRQNLSPLSKKTRAREPETLFSLANHVCRRCFGRLLSAPGTGNNRRYVCSNCGESASGQSPDVLCACGMTLKERGPNIRLLVCTPNPNPTAELPSLFVAAAAAAE